MDALLRPLFLLAGAHLAGVTSPGPSFLYVARTAAADSRRAGLIAALSMSLGAGIWAAATLLGLSEIFARYNWLYSAAKIGGGVYLLWISIQIWRHAATPITLGRISAGVAKDNVFVHALLFQLSNPKVAIFFGSIFITILPQHLPYWFRGLVLAIILVVEFLWYAFVTLVLSHPKARGRYLAWKKWIDRITAFYLTVIAIRLILVE